MSDSSQRDQVVVVRVRRDLGWLGRVRDDDCVSGETVDELGGDGGGDEAPELRASQHIDELVEQRGAGDQFEALLDPGGKDLPRRAGWRDRRRHEHVRVQNGPHAPLSALGRAPLTAHRVQLAVRELHRFLGIERLAGLARLLL